MLKVVGTVLSRFSNSPAVGGRGSFAGAYRGHGPAVGQPMEPSQDPAEARPLDLTELGSVYLQIKSEHDQRKHEPYFTRSLLNLGRILDILGWRPPDSAPSDSGT